MDGSLLEPVRWEGPPPVTHLLSPTHRVHHALPPDATAAVFSRGVCTLEGPVPLTLVLPGPTSDAFVSVDERAVLALVDANPISDFEAHPDKRGNQLDLGDASASEWIAALVAGLDVVASHLPGLREEMRLLVHQFVPVGTDSERHLSATYREAVGTIYLTLHPKLMTMTEAISVSELFARADELDGQRVRVEGEVLEVCKKKGCWMNLSGDQPDTQVRIKVQDDVIVFPTTAEGKYAVTEGLVKKMPLSLDETRAHLAHEAEEQGREFDPASVTQAITIVRVDGLGAMIRDSK